MAEADSILAKAAWRLIPVMALMYVVSFLDRVNIGFAALTMNADLGLGARCLVVDLDNTLWGGIVGEEGALGVVVGEGPDGEAYADFQAYVAALGRRGVILAVAYGRRRLVPAQRTPSP